METLYILQSYMIPIAAAVSGATDKTHEGMALGLNLTVLLSVITVVLGAMGTLIAIYGRKLKPGEQPCEENMFCKNRFDYMKRISENAKHDKEDLETDITSNSRIIKEYDTLNKTEHKEMREIIRKMELAIKEIEGKNENMKTSIEDMKENRKQFVLQLEILLNQLSHYIQG